MVAVRKDDPFVEEEGDTTRPDPRVSAREAGLRYVSDDTPGISRKRRGKYFSYVGPRGDVIRDPRTLERIRSLGVPPAWTDVWICPSPRGHIQATGRDQKGRKQYRYHPRWREVRDDTKYSRMIAFGKALPVIRKRTDADLSRPGLPRQKVLAAVVQLLEKTLIRVGNQEYARTNKSYGLTTLRDRHVRVEGSEIRFTFRGKSGKDHRIGLKDRRLAAVVKRCREVPGQELFQYGTRQTIDSGDVNAYLYDITGQDFTAKDFRTWAGTVLATLVLQEFESGPTTSQAKKNVVNAIKHVAERLGNTPAIARKSYVHPAVLDTYLDGSMLESLADITEEQVEQALDGLAPEEQSVMNLLQRRLTKEQTGDRKLSTRTS